MEASHTCIDKAISELRAERENIEAKLKTIEEEKNTLIKTMEINFLKHKEQIQALLKEGIPPDKICKKFDKCGVPVDLIRVSNCLKNDLNAADKFGKTMFYISGAIGIFSTLVFLVKYAPGPIVLFGVFAVGVVLMIEFERNSNNT